MYGYDDQKELKRLASREQALDELRRKCSVVWSAPTCAHITGDILALFGVPSLLVKTPMKVVVGLSEANDSKVDYGWCSSLDIDDASYGEWQAPENLKTNILQVIDDFRRSRGLGHKGLRIHFLEDIPRGRQNASPIGVGARAAALAASLLAWSGELPASEAGKWKGIDRFGSASLDQSGRDIFDKVFRLGWKLASANHNGRESGAEVFAALIEDSFPCVYFTECRSGLGDQPPPHDLPLDVSADYNSIDALHYWGYRATSLVTKVYDRPFQYGLVFSGYEQDPLGSITEVILAEEKLRAIKEGAWPGGEVTIALGDVSQATWVERTKRPSRSVDAWTSLLLSATLNSLQIAKLMYSSIESGKLDFGALSNEMTNHHERLRSIGLVSPHVDETRQWLTSSFPGKIATKISGKCGANEDTGGGLFFISDVGVARALRELMSSAFLDRRAAYRPRVDYVSTDAEGSVGVGVESLTGDADIVQAQAAGLKYERYWVAVNGRKNDEPLPRTDVARLALRRRTFDIWVNEDDAEFLVRGDLLRLPENLRKLLKFILWEKGPGPLDNREATLRVWDRLERAALLSNLYHRLSKQLNDVWQDKIEEGERGRFRTFRPGNLTYCWIVAECNR